MSSVGRRNLELISEKGFNIRLIAVTAFFSIFPQTILVLKKLSVLFYFTFCLLSSTFSQDSCNLRITLLTCAPGAELYSTFGHTAIRVQDVASGLDEVYNYGTFEFAPDFYSKFVRGQLLYALSVESFNEFMYQYQVESRAVIEQNLALGCVQKTKLFAALRLNSQPQNKNYRYDFLFDNCTTRARDMVDTGSGGKVTFKNILPQEPPTFRNLIYIYLNKANQDWSKLGIDLLLGAKMDRKASNTEAMFLPDNLLKAFDSTTIDSRPLVSSKRTILPMPSVDSESLFITPLIAFSLLLVIIVTLTLTNKRWAQTMVGILDFLLFFILGLVGVLLLFMWFGTNHALCANNYNLLWALPTHVVAAFFVHKKAHWVQQYFKMVFWITILLLISWTFLPQQMNNAFSPLVISIAIRSWMLSKKIMNADKGN